MLKMLLPTLFLVATGRCLAGDFAIEDPSLTDPPASVQSAIRRDASYRDYDRCVIIGKPIQLADQSRYQYFIVTTANACNWGASLGPIWLVVARKRHAAVVLATGGSALTANPQAHGGLRDVTVLIPGGACRSIERHFRFDGRSYVQVGTDADRDCR